MRREVFVFLMLFWPITLLARDTELLFYRPLTDTTKQLPVVIAAKKTGECWQQSHLIKREDAWRCVAAGKMYDPCFVQRFSSHLDAICIESPWNGSAIQINVATPLDNSSHVPLDMSVAYPWAIELVSGEKCQIVESNERYDGLLVHYQCNRNSVLIGHVQRCKSEWSMLQHSQEGVVTSQIEKAWF